MVKIKITRSNLESSLSVPQVLRSIENLKATVKEMELDCTVDRDAEFRSAEEFRNVLIYADYRITDVAIAIAYSGADVFFNEKQIKPIILPPFNQNPLRINHQAIATREFFVFENNSFIPIITSEPVFIDGININTDLVHPDFPLSVFPWGSFVDKTTESKLATKKVLQKHGILHPRYHEIMPDEYLLLPLLIDRFFETTQTNELVVKGNIGSCGHQVKMFTRDQKNEALTYALKLVLEKIETPRKIDIKTIMALFQTARNSDPRFSSISEKVLKGLDKNSILKEIREAVYLDERITPLDWFEGGQRIDWNIRGLATLEHEPRWIEGVVRYGPMNGNPINISQGSSIAELEEICVKTGASLEDIIRTAKSAARAMYLESINSGVIPAGYLGIDMIASRAGVYVLEVNGSMSGGIGKLCKLRKKPIDGIRDAMLPALGPFLEKNHELKRDAYELVNLPKTDGEILDDAKEAYLENKYEEGIELCTQVLNKDSRNPEALFLKARGLMKRAGKPEASELFRKAGEQSWKWAEAIIMYASSQMQLRELYNAELVLQSLLPLHEENPTLWTVLGQAYFLMNKNNKSKDAMYEALMLDADNPDALEFLALISAKENNFENVKELCQRIKPEKQSSVWADIGCILLNQEKYKEAVECFKKAENGDLFESNFGLGIAYNNMNLFQDAANAFEKALKASDDYDARFCFAKALTNLGDYENAIENLEKCVLENGFDNATQSWLALAYYKKGEKSKAVDMAELLVNGPPAGAPKSFTIPISVIITNDEENDLEDKNSGILSKLNNCVIYDTAGLILYKARHYASAEKALRKSLENELDHDVMFFLGITCAQQGKLIQAAKCYAKATQLTAIDLVNKLNILNIMHELISCEWKNQNI